MNIMLVILERNKNSSYPEYNCLCVELIEKLRKNKIHQFSILSRVKEKSRNRTKMNFISKEQSIKGKWYFS